MIVLFLLVQGIIFLSCNTAGGTPSVLDLNNNTELYQGNITNEEEESVIKILKNDYNLYLKDDITNEEVINVILKHKNKIVKDASKKDKLIEVLNDSGDEKFLECVKKLTQEEEKYLGLPFVLGPEVKLNDSSYKKSLVYYFSKSNKDSKKITFSEYIKCLENDLKKNNGKMWISYLRDVASKLKEEKMDYYGFHLRAYSDKDGKFIIKFGAKKIVKNEYPKEVTFLTGSLEDTYIKNYRKNSNFDNMLDEAKKLGANFDNNYAISFTTPNSGTRLTIPTNLKYLTFLHFARDASDKEILYLGKRWVEEIEKIGIKNIKQLAINNGIDHSQTHLPVHFRIELNNSPKDKRPNISYKEVKW